MSRTTLAAVVAAASLALPASAAAHESPTVSSVKSHAAAAESALDRVQSLVAASDEAAAAVAYAKSRVQTRAATAEARKLTASARARKAMRANKVVAALQDENADVFAELVEAADGAAQVDFAKALAASTKGRDAALTALAGLSERLPAAARGGIAKAMAAIAGDAGTEIEELSELTTSTEVSEEAQAWVDMALGYATEGMTHAIEHLNAVVALVPEAARPHVEAALAKATAALENVTAILDGLFGPGSEGGLPIPELPIFQGLPIPDFLPIG